MARLSNLSVRLDSELKKEAEELFKELGLNMSSAINLFLTKCISTGSIPFEIKKSKPNRKLKKALKEAEKIANGKISSKSYNDFEELLEDLNN